MMGNNMEIPDELIDQLLGDYQGPQQLTGPDGLINQLRKRLIERAAGVELEQHLGYPAGAEPAEGQPNRRNGVSSKTLRTRRRRYCNHLANEQRKRNAPRESVRKRDPLRHQLREEPRRTAPDWVRTLRWWGGCYGRLRGRCRWCAARRCRSGCENGPCTGECRDHRRRLSCWRLRPVSGLPVSIGKALVALVDIALVASGVIGIVARRQVYGTVTTREVLGPTFRIVVGVALIVVLLVVR